MLALLFKSVSHRKKLTLVGRPIAYHVYHTGLALGDGACLVKSDYSCPARQLKCLGALEENTLLCTNATAYHYGNRGCKSQGTGTADDKDGYGAGERLAKLTVNDHPGGEGYKSNKQNHRHENTRNSVGYLSDRRLTCRCVLNHSYNRGNGGIITNLGGFAFHKARRICGSGKEAVAHLLIHGN